MQQLFDVETRPEWLNLLLTYEKFISKRVNPKLRFLCKLDRSSHYYVVADDFCNYIYYYEGEDAENVYLFENDRAFELYVKLYKFKAYLKYKYENDELSKEQKEELLESFRDDFYSDLDQEMDSARRNTVTKFDKFIYYETYESNYFYINGIESNFEIDYESDLNFDHCIINNQHIYDKTNIIDFTKNLRKKILGKLSDVKEIEYKGVSIITDSLLRKYNSYRYAFRKYDRYLYLLRDKLFTSFKLSI